MTDSPTPTPLAFEGATKRFGDTLALDGIDVSIAAGELFAVIGPSGCGKTTALRLLAGFDEPDQGRILIGGRDVAGVPPWRRPVNTVFQSYALFPHLSVAENVAFGPRSQKLDEATTSARVTWALGLVRLGHLAGRSTRALSGGEQQRVALARALACRPGALLLDEPLGALDELLRRQMQSDLRELQRDLGITFLHVTHDQAEALAMADRIAVMRDGRVEQSGTPHEVYTAPRTAFVAEFLGAANLLAAREAAGGVEVAGRLVPADLGHGGDTRRTFTLCIRPEDVSLVAMGGNQTGLPVVVTAVRFEGATELVSCAALDGQPLVARVGAGGAPRPGERLLASWTAERARVLAEPHEPTTDQPA